MALDLGTLYVNIKANTADTQRNIDNVKTSLAGIKNETVNTTNTVNTSFDELGTSVQGFGDDLKDVFSDLKNAGGGIGNILSSLASEGAAMGVVTAAFNGLMNAISKKNEELKEMVKEWKKEAADIATEVDDINTQAAISGLERRTISLFSMYDELTDVSVDTIVEAVSKGFTKNLKTAFDDPNSEAATIFANRGIALYDDSGNAKTTDQIFMEYLAAMQNVEDSLEKRDELQTLFGEQGLKMIPLFNMTPEDWKEILSSYDKYGLSDEEADRFQKYKDTLTELGIAEDIQEQIIASDNLEYLQTIADNELKKTELMNEALKNGTDLDIEAYQAACDAIAEAEAALTAKAAELSAKQNNLEQYQEYTTAMAEIDNPDVPQWKKMYNYYIYGDDWLYFATRNDETTDMMFGKETYDIDANLDDAITYYKDKLNEELAKLELEFENSSMTTSAYVAQRKALEEEYNANIKALTDLSTPAEEAGENWAQGLADGMTSEESITEMVDAASQLVETVTSTTATEMDSHSPSKVAAKYGLYWAQGLAQGILQGADAVKAAAQFAVNYAVNGTNQSVTVNQYNSYSGNENSFAAHYFSEKRLGKTVANAIV